MGTTPMAMPVLHFLARRPRRNLVPLGFEKLGKKGIEKEKGIQEGFQGLTMDEWYKGLSRLTV